MLYGHAFVIGVALAGVRFYTAYFLRLARAPGFRAPPRANRSFITAFRIALLKQPVQTSPFTYSCRSSLGSSSCSFRCVRCASKFLGDSLRELAVSDESDGGAMFILPVYFMTAPSRSVYLILVRLVGSSNHMGGIRKFKS